MYSFSSIFKMMKCLFLTIFFQHLSAQHRMLRKFTVAEKEEIKTHGLENSHV